jgi:hypothetical protein
MMPAIRRPCSTAYESAVISTQWDGMVRQLALSRRMTARLSWSDRYPISPPSTDACPATRPGSDLVSGRAARPAAY